MDTHAAKELEILVLQHQVAVRRRQVKRRDTKFVAGFDTVFTADGTGIIRTRSQCRTRMRTPSDGVQRTLRVPGLAPDPQRTAPRPRYRRVHRALRPRPAFAAVTFDRRARALWVFHRLRQLSAFVAWTGSAG
jgi:hypothetical protein